MAEMSYQDRRSKLKNYFDRTAVDAWAKLTSDAPVSGIRATVRAGRDQTRQRILNRLPEDLTGKRILDAGCGTGALALEMAKRGAKVVAVDLSPKLVKLAQERIPAEERQNIAFHSGDMLDEAFGEFDYVVGMDSMIHYQSDDMVNVLERLAERTHQKIIFTFAPSSALLEIMIRVGRLFPRKDRAPFIEPVSEQKLRDLVGQSKLLHSWRVSFTLRISSGFYQSQIMELRRFS
jgi:magnesium-protoporphyrin O-methyltransferase